MSEFSQVGYYLGEMQSKSDAELLREYAQHSAEAAFAELVHCHASLIYSAALRQVESPDTAAELTQNVFINLSRGAVLLGPRLAAEASLAGWLCRCARNLSLNHRRDEFRRRTRERLAMEQITATPDAAPDWEKLRHVLDDAMSELCETDYDALVLRFYQDHDFRAVGIAIGVNDDTAQKRVARALEKLRDLLAQRGIRTTAGALGVAITANAVQAAPASLLATISTAALTGTAVYSSTLIATTKTIAMTTLQKIAITATIAVLAGAGIYEARQISQLREQVQTLRQQQAPLAENIGQLQRQRDNMTNQLTGLLAENSRLKANPNQSELLKLRGQVTRLRMEADQANDPVVKKALRWKANVEKMKLLFAEHPDQQVPEMKLLSDDYFFDLARGQDLESSNGVRKAFSEIRMRAKNTFIPSLQEALNKFINENQGRLPNAVSDLKPYFQNLVDDAVLDQYKMLFTGNLTDVKGNYVLIDKQVVDPEYDNAWQIGPNAFGPNSSGLETARFEAMMSTLKPVLESFKNANGGVPTSFHQLQPFITTPEQQAVFDQFVKDGVT